MTTPRHAVPTSQLDFFDPTIGSIPGPGALDRQASERLPDQAARDRIRNDLDVTLFVEAAAGAGKTTELVRRMVALIGAGKAELDRMVAVTFTDRAAGEMRLRLRTAIEEVRLETTSDEVRQRFDRAVRQLEAARIGTIHAFCADLLRERPVEAGVDPMFRMVDEGEATRVLDRAFDRWLQKTLADPREGVRRVLRRPPDPSGRYSPKRDLRKAAGTLVEHRDFPSPWRRDPTFEHAKAIDQAISRLRELAELARRGPASTYLERGFARIASFVRAIDLREEAEARDHERLEAEIRELLRDKRAGWTYRGSGEWYDHARMLRIQDVKARRDEVRAQLEATLRCAEADLAARLGEELRPVVERYDELKRQEGALDFLDLLLKARDLVRDNTIVRRELQERFTHFFVDEFQDTDPLQAEILLLLAADEPEASDHREVRPTPGKLFLVGDPKQSIYGFRRADVRLYEETKRRLLERGAELVHLSTSFRSVPEIQEAVNGAFPEHIRPAPDGSQAEYVPLEHFREPVEARPCVVALPAPRPYGRYGDIVNYGIEESYADAVGAFVQWLVAESGWKVTEPGRPDVAVDIRARHICLLTRRLQAAWTDPMRPYVAALEARGISHVLVGGKGFHDREEILALRNVLEAIEWPDDALAVYATLRGPFFGFPDGRLLAFRHRYGSLHPLARISETRAGDAGDGPRAPMDEEDAQVADALRILRELHFARNRRPIADTISRFLAAVRAHAGIASWQAGEQVLANCLRLIERAREFEGRGASSFRAFVELLQEEAERGEGENAPIVEEGTQGVRIMSVHRAKGLEFPIVIVVEPTFGGGDRPPSRHVDSGRDLWAEALCGAVPQDVLDHAAEETERERAEAVRLAYVAATRARDLLVVPGVGDGEELRGWAEYLNPAIYPAIEARRASRPAPGCPAFREDTVLGRPPKALDAAENAVRPGLHVSRAGSTVTWWDPAALDLEKEEATGLRAATILAQDASGEISTAGIEAQRAWQERRRETVENGAKPELRVVTVAELASERVAAMPRGEPARLRHLGDEGVQADDDTGPDVKIIEVPGSAGERPGGKRFGELVHRVLATVPLAAGEAEIRAVTESEARFLGAPRDEMEEALGIVARVLALPLLRRTAATRDGGSQARREVPVFVAESADRVVEGVLDLAFREETDGGGKWTVIDFKTDREIAGARPVYEEQVRLYGRAVERATGEEASSWVLVVSSRPDESSPSAT